MGALLLRGLVEPFAQAFGPVTEHDLGVFLVADAVRPLRVVVVRGLAAVAGDGDHVAGLGVVQLQLKGHAARLLRVGPRSERG